MSVHMYTYMYICVYIYEYMYICIYVVYVYVYVYWDALFICNISVLLRFQYLWDVLPDNAGAL